MRDHSSSVIVAKDNNTTLERILVILGTTILSISPFFSVLLKRRSYDSLTKRASFVAQQPRFKTLAVKKMLALQTFDLDAMGQLVATNCAVISVSAIKNVSLVGNGIKLRLGQSITSSKKRLSDGLSPDQMIDKLKIHHSSMQSYNISFDY